MDEGGDLMYVVLMVLINYVLVLSVVEGENFVVLFFGNIWKIYVLAGDEVVEGDVLLILEVMKMEIEICVLCVGVISVIEVNEGDVV